VYGQDVVEGYGGRIVLAPIQHDSNHRSLAR
jgi:hypothetical protein